MSLVPPGANGTMIRTGRAGYACAHAMHGASGNTAPVATDRNWRRCMGDSLAVENKHLDPTLRKKMPHPRCRGWGASSSLSAIHLAFRRALGALERVVDLLEEVRGLVGIGSPRRVEVLQRIERYDLRLAFAFAEQLFDALARRLGHRVVLGDDLLVRERTVAGNHLGLIVGDLEPVVSRADHATNVTAI